MQYNILVFNQRSLDEIDKKELHCYLLDVSFETLTAQYQLDPAFIAPARSNLEVVISKEQTLHFFLVKYGTPRDQPIVVYEWDVESGKGRGILDGVFQRKLINEISEALTAANSIIEIELAQAQLNDMGLLLAYEIARWIANKGGGVILGLDNTWYRLNKHQAFIPITSKNHNILK